VPADAFYEWQKLDAKNKQPFAIAMKDNQLYALAGLWEKWKDRNAGAELLTFTVITTDPNEVVQPMHDRMPVIIPEGITAAGFSLAILTGRRLICRGHSMRKR
jgi:putative SOS response-associated peptidase YedK